MDMIISPVKENQMAEIAALERESFSRPWGERALAQERKNHQTIFLAAAESTSESHIIGFGFVRTVLDSGDLEEIAVKQSVRGQGVGQKLLQELVEQCRSSGIKTITLEVRQSNQPAISLYQKLGFVHIHRRKNYYDAPVEDGLIFQLQLNEEDNFH